MPRNHTEPAREYKKYDTLQLRYRKRVEYDISVRPEVFHQETNGRIPAGSDDRQ